MSQPVFNVGELAIMQHATYFYETDGGLGIVTGPLMMRRGFDLHLMKWVRAHVYQITVLNGTEQKLLCRPWQLRKLEQGGKPKSKKRRCSSDRNRKLVKSAG